MTRDLAHSQFLWIRRLTANASRRRRCLSNHRPWDRHRRFLHQLHRVGGLSLELPFRCHHRPCRHHRCFRHRLRRSANSRSVQAGSVASVLRRGNTPPPRADRRPRPPLRLRLPAVPTPALPRPGRRQPRSPLRRSVVAVVAKRVQSCTGRNEWQNGHLARQDATAGGRASHASATSSNSNSRSNSSLEISLKPSTSSPIT